MRLIAVIEFAAVFAGVIAMVAGQYFSIPKGFHFGLFMAGAGFALGGLEAVVTRRMCFRASDDAYDAYAGAPAFIVGVMALLVGAGLIATAYLFDGGQWQSTVNYLTRRPAPVLVAAGIPLIGIGTLLMLNPLQRTGVLWTLLVRIPRSLVGLILIAGGLAGVGLGVWEWFEPQAFDAFVRKLPPLKLPKLF